MKKQSSSHLHGLFDPELFRQQGHSLVDGLADFLDESLSGKRDVVLPHIDPAGMLERWPGDFGEDPAADFNELIGKVLSDSNNLRDPRYIGHQCCTPLPLAALCALLGNYLNNGSAIYEMGPANVAMEKRLIQWMAGLIGYPAEADGIFTHGGTAGNLTALLAARQSKSGFDIWTEGAMGRQPLTLLVSEQSHYSIQRAMGIMGLGEGTLSLVPVDDAYHIDLARLRRKYREAVSGGSRVFAVVGNACSTATGSYDDLEGLADFAEEFDLWFHVDAAHGASALLSGRYRHLLNGLHRADSIVWDAHKMLMTPALATAVIFRDGARSYEAFSQRASYLFEKDAREEWYNYAHRTLECTKSMMGLKLYLALRLYGTRVFSDFIDYTYDLTRSFAEEIQRSPDFELAVEPESNIICFRFLRPGVKDLDLLQKEIRQEIVGRGKYYIVQTRLRNGFYLRCTIINPHTKMDDLLGLLEEIRRIASPRR
ncbi:MAG: aminotransferase class V-fold PLP-dependent enzyme [Candidatus Krumholzibacteriota bacterium]|nr:aminotransferase class V-fold PLP-dependent enzyme [Candidatus Krumholzibacteriota bacterium]